jgi:putative ABC transport system permease protein
MRSDVIVWMAEAAPVAARHELQRLPGVNTVEAARPVPVRFVHGHRSVRGSILGMADEPQLLRIIDIDGREVRAGDGGLVLSERLLEKLGLAVGDTVLVETLQGRPRTLRLPVSASVRDMMGLNAWMPRRELNRQLGEDDLAAQFVVATQRGREPEFLLAVMALPRIVGAFSKNAMWRNMQEISARNIRIMSTVLTVFACVIAVGVVYNNIRITLAERTWELASLRVLGFTRAEVTRLLLGEMALLIAVALPLGMLLGYGLVHLLSVLLRSDEYLFPVVISARTYAIAGLAVVVAGAASAWIVRRNIDRLDMVSALKTRE